MLRPRTDRKSKDITPRQLCRRYADTCGNQWMPKCDRSANAALLEVKKGQAILLTEVLSGGSTDRAFEGLCIDGREHEARIQV